MKVLIVWNSILSILLGILFISLPEIEQSQKNTVRQETEYESKTMYADEIIFRWKLPKTFDGILAYTSQTYMGEWSPSYEIPLHVLLTDLLNHLNLEPKVAETKKIPARLEKIK